MAVVNGGDKADPTLHSLADELVADLMQLTDAELLAEVEAEGLDPTVEAAQVRAKIAAAIIRSGQARLAEAKAGVSQARASPATNVRPLRIQNRDFVLGRFANDDTKLKSRLTMAARHGGDAMTDGEKDSVLDDLRELGAIDDEGNPI